MTDLELDRLVWAAVRRWGRKGMNEAIVGSIVGPHTKGMPAQRIAQSVDRLLSDGHLYRDRRRTWTYLKPVSPGPAGVPAASETEQPGLWA